MKIKPEWQEEWTEYIIQVRDSEGWIEKWRGKGYSEADIFAMNIWQEHPDKDIRLIRVLNQVIGYGAREI